VAGAESRVRSLVDLTETILIAVAFALVIRAYVVGSFVVNGDSMNPTLFTGERVCISRLTIARGGPERGDIVVFQYPLDPSRAFVKRVVGLPGDSMEIRGGRVLVNGSFLSESYSVIRDQSSLPAMRVPEGQVFVLGDNRPVSEDSRFFGFVPLQNLRGEVFLVYWPPSRFEWVGARAGGY